MNTEDMTRTSLGIENDTQQYWGRKKYQIEYITEVEETSKRAHLSQTQGIENDTQHCGVWQIWM